MNGFIKMQIDNMLQLSKNFKVACEIAAIQDDGKLDKTEAKQLKEIKNATDEFIKRLKAIQ